VISDHVNAWIETLLHVFWTYSNCARLLQSIADAIIFGGSKPELFFRAVPHVSDLFPRWILKKTGVSDNCGSYENLSYLSCLLTDFEKIECLLDGSDTWGTGLEGHFWLTLGID